MDEMRFEELGLRPEIVRAVKKMGFEEASPIQAKAIPVMMSGRDLIGQAQTGTGKTAAFGIPLLERLTLRIRSCRRLCCARPGNWQSRWQRRSAILHIICMELRCCRFTVDRRSSNRSAH